MDIQMPVMDGYEATRGIREFEKQGMRIETSNKTSDRGRGPSRDAQMQSIIDNHQSRIPRVPIVAMTGHAVEGYREECLAGGNG